MKVKTNFPVNIPQEVQAALDRMCTPLDISRLSGVTAEQDARCMSTIKTFIDGLASKKGSIELPDQLPPATLRDGEYEAARREGWNACCSEFAQLNAISMDDTEVLDCGIASARAFWNELLAEHESLAMIQSVFGPETLADCMYLQNSILIGTHIESEGLDDPKSQICNLVQTLQSAERWMKFIHIVVAG